MNNKKLVIVVFFILTLVTGITAVYLGNKLQVQDDITPGDTFAATMSEGVSGCGNPTTNNPKGEEICNSPTDEQLQYCPSYIGAGEQLETRFDKIKIVYDRDFGETDIVALNGEDYPLCGPGERCNEMNVDFEIPASSIDMRVSFLHEGTTYYALGWQSPVNGVCGSCYHRYQGDCLACSAYGVNSLTNLPEVSKGYSEIAVQCWADPPTKDADFDFNDFAFRLMGNNFPECESLTVEPSNAPVGSTITITCEAIDDGGVDKVSFSYNATGDTNWCDTDWQMIADGDNISGDIYTYDWTVPNIPGTYTIKADVYDTAGDMCTGNPGGICDVEGIGSCPNCSAEFTIVGAVTNTPTPTVNLSITPIATVTGTIYPTNTSSPTKPGGPTNTSSPTKPGDGLPPTALDTPRDKIIAGVILMVIGGAFRYYAMKYRKDTIVY